MTNKNQKGFTLIELLVVIAIIGLLASVVLLALNSARARSRDAKRVADVRQIQTAMELYLNDNPSVGYLTSTAAIPCTLASTGGCLSGLVPSYLQSMPTAPRPVDGGCADANNPYILTFSSVSSYTVTFCIGSGVGTYTAGVRTLTPGGIQ